MIFTSDSQRRAIFAQLNNQCAKIWYDIPEKRMVAQNRWLTGSPVSRGEIAEAVERVPDEYLAGVKDISVSKLTPLFCSGSAYTRAQAFEGGAIRLYEKPMRMTSAGEERIKLEKTQYPLEEYRQEMLSSTLPHEIAHTVLFRRPKLIRFLSSFVPRADTRLRSVRKLPIGSTEEVAADVLGKDISEWMGHLKYEPGYVTPMYMPSREPGQKSLLRWYV
jgi:hypothetical protein